jgi:DNA-directed RNA polymerase specialized sigma24 family protein
LSNIDKSKDGNFIAWINRIAHNYCISEWRRQRFRFERIEYDIADEHDDKLVLIEKMIEEIELLPDKHQQVIELRLLGYRFQDISYILKTQKGTILQWYRQAVLMLRKQFVNKELIYVRRGWNNRKIY